MVDVMIDPAAYAASSSYHDCCQYRYRPMWRLTMDFNCLRREYLHIVLDEDDSSFIAPFDPEIVSKEAFEYWVIMGLPPCEPFGVVFLSLSLLASLFIVFRNYNVEKGQWDLLATIYRMSEVP